MTTITINKCVYNFHPVYDLYAGSEDGTFINIIKKVPNKGNKTYDGYLICMVRKHGQPGFKKYCVHRFIWECFNGIIPEEKEIDHINNNREDNRLCNLQLVTHQQNCKKAAKDRDYTFIANNFKNRKCVKATNRSTSEVTYYNSMYAVGQRTGVNASIVKMVCDGLNHRKSGVSKKDGHSYTFEYIKENDLPNNYKKSSNIRPRRVPDEYKKKHHAESMKKWQNKEYMYICSKCGKTFKNSSKYVHNKKCNSQKQ